MTKKITVTVGIAAYNAERNISKLLKSIITQKEDHFKLEKIIVHSDKSLDATVKKIHEIKDSRIKLIKSTKRQGFANSISKILKVSSSKLTILLNDDIVINDKLFMSKITKPFILSSDTGLACAHPQPITSSNFISRAITSGFRAYDKIRYEIRSGNNIHTVDGKVLVISIKFKNKIIFNNNMGNVDGYLYFLCLKNGYKYAGIKDAYIYYKNPSNMSDYIKWYVRNFSNKNLLKKQFGEVVDLEYAFPKFSFIKYRLLEMIKNPLGSIFIIITGIYIRQKANTYSHSFNSKWDVISSTKSL